MAQYGHCEDCGTTLEKWGCPNCNYEEVGPMLDALADQPESYPDWTMD